MNEHQGHRQRMRERFLRKGLDGFADHEILELLLFDCIPQGNVNPLAHRLMEAFGSLRGVFEATTEQLMTVPGIGLRSATHLSMMLPLFRRYQQCVSEGPRKLSSRAEASAYCLSLLAGWRTERFYLVSLDADSRLLGARQIGEGTLDEVNAYPRLAVEAALNHNAYSVFLCHNHPGGSPSPSGADVETTLALQRALNAIGISLLDHLIVADGRITSMAQLGLLDVGVLSRHMPETDNRSRAADSSGYLMRIGTSDAPANNPPED